MAAAAAALINYPLVHQAACGADCHLASFQAPAPLLHSAASSPPRSSLQVFMKDGQLYGFKGLAGKLGPIGVHASMLLCMAGFVTGARE